MKNTNEWIPCSKQLPNKGQSVLVTVVVGGEVDVAVATYTNTIDLETGEILPKLSFMYGETDMDDGMYFKVTAWLPIPEPYRKSFDVAIVGSRTFKDYEFMKRKLDKCFMLKKPTAIICGMANGADLMGKRYAEENDIPVMEYPAEWDKYGKTAGYIRNTEMADVADAVIAFWDGKSEGTKHMIETSQKRNIPTRIIKF